MTNEPLSQKEIEIKEFNTLSNKGDSTFCCVAYCNGKERIHLSFRFPDNSNVNNHPIFRNKSQSKENNLIFSKNIHGKE